MLECALGGERTVRQVYWVSGGQPFRSTSGTAVADQYEDEERRKYAGEENGVIAGDEDTLAREMTTRGCVMTGGE